MNKERVENLFLATVLAGTLGTIGIVAEALIITPAERETLKFQPCPLPEGAEVLYEDSSPSGIRRPWKTQKAVMAFRKSRQDAGFIKRMECEGNGKTWKESPWPISDLPAEVLGESLGKAKEELCPIGDLTIMDAETRRKGIGPTEKCETGAWSWQCATRSWSGNYSPVPIRPVSTKRR